MYEIPKVILLIETSRSAGRSMINGIMKYSNLHGPWAFYREPPSYIKLAGKTGLVTWLKDIQANGIIANDHYAKKLWNHVDKDIPVVFGGIEREKYPTIPTFTDEGRLTGEMAAEYFLNLGLRNFAYYGLVQIHDFRNRAKSFADKLALSGYETHIYKPMARRRKQVWETEIKRLADWLVSLPKPVGLMAYADDYSQQIAEACKLANIVVPDDVAILGVDNDSIVCKCAYPPLSSIAMNYEKSGYEIAELLDRLMAGQKPDNDLVVIEPTHVIERQSTSILNVGDKDVNNALRFIKENANRAIQVGDVADYSNVARRTLQQKFQKVLGRSVLDEIKKARISLICKMLVETNMSISQIALKLEHQSVEHISRYFKQAKKMSPLEYRKKFGRK